MRFPGRSPTGAPGRRGRRATIHISFVHETPHKKVVEYISLLLYLLFLLSCILKHFTLQYMQVVTINQRYPEQIVICICQTQPKYQQILRRWWQSITTVQRSPQQGSRPYPQIPPLGRQPLFWAEGHRDNEQWRWKWQNLLILMARCVWCGGELTCRSWCRLSPALQGWSVWRSKRPDQGVISDKIREIVVTYYTFVLFCISQTWES